MQKSTTYFYSTVSEAVTQLQKRGYSIDFNLKENVLKFESGSLALTDFDIMEVYRYEGDSDPGDEAVVYAIESKSGLKGIIVSGFGISANGNANRILSKMHFHQK
ncbi:MAG: hypothetical protein JJE25_01105 [Bacteroidia bacterium]|nr:hypothetical protein [Bacteroidia bacterium]